MRIFFPALALAALALPNSAIAQTTYTGTRTAGANSATFSLTTYNTVTTLQTLQFSEVASWSVTLAGNGAFTFNSFTPGSGFFLNGGSLTANASGLFFNYNGDGLVDFYNTDIVTNEIYFCAINFCGAGQSGDVIIVNSLEQRAMPAGNQQIGSATPEPTSWALMIGGFAVVGGAMRRRRRNAALAFA